MSLIKNTVAVMRGTMMNTMPGMLTCTELGHVVTDFRDGKLSNVEALQFKAHLKLCADFNMYADESPSVANASKAETIRSE